MACKAEYLIPKTPPPGSSISPLGFENKVANFGDGCFTCRDRDRWYKDRPDKAKKLRPSSSESRSSPSLSSSLSPMEIPVVRCACGKGPCSVFTSHSAKNPDRKFYSCCQRELSNKCGFFKWLDEVLEFRAPPCPCGAGACSINRDSNGRWFFACRIKKGHGACPFFQWADSRVNNKMNMHLCTRLGCSAPQGLKTNHQVISSLQSKKDEAPKKDLVMQEIKSSDHQVLDTFHSEEGEEPFWNLEMQETDLIMQEETLSNHQVLSTLHSEEDETPKRDYLVMQETKSSDLPNSTKVNCLSYVVCPSENHCKSISWMQISAEGDILNQDVIRQNIGLQVCGWLGVFPSLDPVNVPEDATLLGVGSSAIVPNGLENTEAIIQPPRTPRKDAQLPSGVSRSHSRCQIRNTWQNDSISSSIFDNVGQGLLKILVDKNLVDCEEMRKIAKSFLEVLRGLSINTSSFSKYVMKYIDYKSRLATIEDSVRKGLSSQELEDIFNSKKACFEKISHEHEVKKAECEAAESHFQSLCEDFSCVKKSRLHHNLDQELECSEAETLELKSSLLKIKRKMSATRRSIEAAREEMEEAFANESEREFLLEEARTVLEMARAQLPS